MAFQERSEFPMRDNVLIFDPTNHQLSNIVPHCSQICLVLALFRGAWKKIEAIFEAAVEACKSSSEDESVSGVVEEVTSRLMAMDEGFLLGIFALIREHPSP